MSNTKGVCNMARLFLTREEAKAKLEDARKAMAFSKLDQFFVEPDTYKDNKGFYIAMYNNDNCFCGYY